MKILWLFVGIFPAWLSKMHSSCPKKQFLIRERFPKKNCVFMVFPGLRAKTFRLPGYNFFRHGGQKCFLRVQDIVSGENEILRKKTSLPKSFLNFLRRDFGFMAKLLLHGFWNCIWHVQIFCWNCFWILIQKFRTFDKIVFPMVFQTEFDMYRGMFGRKVFADNRFFVKFFAFWAFLSKKCRQCCQNCILRLQEKLWKQKFVLKKQFFIIFLGYERKLSGQLVKKLANFATTAFYVSRWTVWGIKKGKKKSIF